MIQRKQSIFLLVAFVVSVVCLCLPLGSIEPTGMTGYFKLYNLWLDKINTVDYSVCSLFIVLLLSGIVSLLTIFLYNNRKLQGKVCLCNEFLLVIWYILLGVTTRNVVSPDAAFHVSFAACLPAVSIILNVMARAGIRHDERLVRAADRIR